MLPERDGNGLRAVGGAELVEDGVEVLLDDGSADAELYGYVAVGEAERHRFEDFGLTRRQFGRGVCVDLSRDGTSVPPLSDEVRTQMDRRVYAGPQLRLDQSDPQHSFFVVTSPNTKLFSGFSSMRSFDLGDGVSVEPGTTRLGWCTMSLVSLDGNGFGRGSRVLLAATGLSHNGGSKFRHLEGTRWTSRDDDFGREDTVVEGVRARVSLRGGATPVCRALDGDGLPVRDVPVRVEGGETVVDIGPEYRTVWYEIRL